MPGGIARLRVNGAITRRLGSVSGPSLNGSNSFEDRLMGMCFRENDRYERFVHCGGKRNGQEPFGRRRLATHDLRHMTDLKKGVSASTSRIRSKSRRTQWRRSLGPPVWRAKGALTVQRLL